MLLNRNAHVPKPAVNYFQMKRKDEVGFCGEKTYPKISINKCSEIGPIDQIMLHSTIHNQFLNSYFSQLSTEKNCHVSNIESSKFCSIKQLKLFKK